MAVELKPSEIDSVENMGEIDGNGVNLVRTVGGLYLAVGKKKKTDPSQEVLGFGSHPAIVRYNVQKSISSFRPAMMKSEGEVESEIYQFSPLLGSSLVEKGFDLYTIKKSEDYEFVITKNQMEILKFNASQKDDVLDLQKSETFIPLSMKPLVKALKKAVASIASEENLTIKLNGKEYKPEEIV